MELHQQTGKYLLAFFGEDRHVDTISRQDARAFKAALAAGELQHVNSRKTGVMAASTVNLHIRNARKIFTVAADDDLVLFNAFDKLAAGTPAVEKVWHYNSMGEFNRLLAVCPRPGWRVFLALCRLAGLRQGEALRLRRRHVDWGHKCLSVWAPKTKRSRLVPISLELQSILREAFDRTTGDDDFIVTGVTIPNLWRDFQVIAKHAGVQVWKKWCHTLRKNCEEDWNNRRHPLYKVAAWMGHSSSVAMEFYLPDDRDLQAAASTSIFGEVTQKVTQTATSAGPAVPVPCTQLIGGEGVGGKAGDRIRTGDVQLGKSPGRLAPRPLRNEPGTTKTAIL